MRIEPEILLPTKLRLSRKWFNPLYFILNNIIKDDNIRNVHVYGGKSSAKTVSISQILSKECYISNASSIAFRKEGTLIQTTLKKSFNLAISTMRMQDAFEKLQFMYRCIDGGEIVLKGLDDPEKAKGIESYKYVYLDELNHFEEEEYEQFNLSLRGIPGQKIFTSWNPINEKSWVKKNLLDTVDFIDIDIYGTLPDINSFVKISSDGKSILIKTTYKDNYWIVGSPDGSYGYRDNNLIATYESLREHKYNIYKINVLGEWGSVRTGGEFWKQFNEIKHVKPVEVDLSTTIHISLDENVNPYVTQTVWQVFTTNKEIKQVHEILSRSPDNNAPKAAKQAVRWLNQIGYGNVVYVYGDPSGGKRSTIDANNASFFDKYIETLQSAGFRVEKRVARSAPEVALSAAFINDIFETNLYGWSIAISDRCFASIEDYILVKEDAEGRMLKEKVKDKNSGVTYEPQGHCFVGETLITTIEGQKRIDKIKKGDLVLTRKGYRKVLNVFDNGERKVNCYKIGSIKLLCTPYHNIWSDGFKPIGKLKGVNQFIIYNENLNQWKEKRLFIKKENSIDTLMDILKQNTVQDYALRKVYDIEVDEEHEYFANNILVHNCSDAFRYFTVMVLKDEFAQYKVRGKRQNLSGFFNR